MEKKANTQHHYYYTIYRYENVLRAIWYGFIFLLAHWPSLMVHVFTRKNMGERYYTLAASLTFIIILSQPFFFKDDLRFLEEILHYFNWFALVFLAVFLFFSIVRRLEFKRHSHEFDPDKFSKFEGERFVYKWFIAKFPDNKVANFLFDHLFVRKHFESLLAIIIGLILLILPFSFLVGLLLFVSGLLDMARTHVQYAKGRHYVLDQYDNLIVSEEFADSFVNSKEPEDSKFLDLAHLPRSKNRKVNQMLADMIDAQSVQPGTAQPELE